MATMVCSEYEVTPAARQLRAWHLQESYGISVRPADEGWLAEVSVSGRYFYEWAETPFAAVLALSEGPLLTDAFNGPQT